MDNSEFSAVIPASGANANYLFYKSSPDDLFFHVNILKPLVNTDSEFYTLRTRLYYDASLTQVAFAFVKVTIIADCSQETITASSVPNMAYIVH
jgi:hypothetical protein